ncbi:molecular chaperone DjlA [Iodidimonas gelatinilytica]|uniref:Molecular chaperone DjlA n=1 Tax=Iodidimonas gelatinilytica TaxID=1236966 RepID=A0A5A7MXG8_9PROT|nr:DnaJ family molecular chaperone [Iodidimonas gelatinilytica]GEQ99629.1 molecular chaperone DjlA [Iodidimonas gelatinilytica]
MSIWESVTSAAFGLLRRITGSEPDDMATRKITFTIGVIALSAKMAKADGQVTQDEVEAFQAIFKVPAHELKNVARVYDMAKRDTAGFEVYARQVAALFTDRAIVLEELIDALFYIAKADGSVHPAELDFLKKVATTFGFSDAKFDCLAARHIGPDRSSPYVVLGIDPSISDDDLKATYRRLIKENHPDHLMALGLPREFIQVATDRLAAITVAYERVRAQRNQ